ncbi:hypothetical protein ACFSNO_31450 [Streptomyces cirratus]
MGELPGVEGLRIGGVAEQFALPDREVRVLERQFRPQRILVADPGGIGGGEVPDQDVQGPAVPRDVVQDDQQVVVLVALGEQLGAQGDFVREVERAPYGGGDQPLALLTGAGDDGQVRCGGTGGEDLLPGAAPVVREEGAERFVPVRDVRQGAAQRIMVERAPQAQPTGMLYCAPSAPSRPRNHSRCWAWDRGITAVLRAGIRRSRGPLG